MQVVHAWCCGLLTEEGGRVRKHVRTFGTMTADLLALSDWLDSHGVTQIAMESTGVYWKPIFNLLEAAGRTIVLVNAQHVRAVPGRKTDVKDAEWIADLIRHGLVNPSFVPPPEIRALRDLVRHRRSLADSLASERNRTLKLMESTNIKLSAVATDVFGVSGMAMLKALIAGDATPADMADLAKGRLRRKLGPLAQALDGRLTETHRFLLRMQLNRLEEMERDILALDRILAEKAKPYSRQVELLIQIPGVDRQIALVIIAEIGVDLSHWPTAQRDGQVLSTPATRSAGPGHFRSSGERRR